MRMQFVLVIVFCFCAHNARSEELQGAAKTLTAVSEHAREIVADDKPQKVTTLNEWKRQLGVYRDQQRSLAAEEQARQWLQLLDQLMALNDSAIKRGEGAYEFNNQFTLWLPTVPPPAAWPELAKLVDDRQIPVESQNAIALHALRLLTHTLVNDERGCVADRDQIEKLRNALKETQQAGRAFRGATFDASTSEIPFESDFPTPRDIGSPPGRALGNTPEEIVGNFEKQLGNTESPWVYIPDLVKLVGAEKAEELLKKAILEQSGSFFRKLLGGQREIVIQIEGENTQKLAKKIAMENVKSLRAPLWQLVETVADAALYEAMFKRFGDKTAWVERQPAQQLAANCYLASLLDDGRLDDAKKVIDERLKGLVGNQDRFGSAQILGDDDSRSLLLKAARSRKLFEIFDGLLTPEVKGFPWGDYFAVAEKADQEDEALKHARAVLDGEKLSASDRQAVAEQLYKACLAQELVDDAVALLKQHLAVRSPESEQDPNSQYVDDAVTFALRLSELGRLVGNPEWERDGLELAIKLHEESPTDEFYNRSGDREIQITRLLLNAKREAEAERLLTRSLARWETRSDRNPVHRSGSGTTQLLGALAAVYDAAGRHEDVLLLIERAPWWRQADVAPILNTPFVDTPLGLVIARALANTGRKDDAKKILLALIDANPGFDPPYETLLALDPEAAVVVFDKAAFNDPFEERPLIWKAKHLLDKGNVRDAGKTIRQAILIDPSDGEQGKERRMFAYTVLADVLDREGDVEGAKTFRKAVAAIRQAEKADDYHAAGLLKRGRTLYKEALELFSDAYCIQSRLAIQLYEAGLTEEAAKHYQRAYELMPDSFGMIESHCFGCEGAFRGQLAQSLAEQVFEGLVKKHPDKPQVHYLLGYLRESQGRQDDAIKHYQNAARLAPNYLNAWNKLEALLAQQPSPPRLLDEAIQAQLRLDPLGKHGAPSTEKARDLKTLWELLEQSATRYASPPTQLLALPASAAELDRERKQAEERAKAARENPREYYEAQEYITSLSTGYQNTRVPMKPGEAIASNERLQSLGSLILRQQ